MQCKREAIIELYRAGIRQCEIVRSLGISKQTISDAIRRYEELGHTQNRPERGK